MEFSVQFQKLCQIEGRRYILIVGMVALTYLMLQSLMLPYGDALKSLFSDNKVMVSVQSGFPSGRLSVESENESEIDPSTLNRDQSNADVIVGRDNGLDEVARDTQDISVTSERYIQDEALQSAENNHNENEISTKESVDLLTVDSSITKPEDTGHIEQIIGPELQDSSERSLESNRNSSSDGNENGESWSQGNSERMEELPESDLSLLSNELDMIRTHRSKFRDGGPPKSVTPIDKMNKIFAQYLFSSINMKPQLSFLHDRDKEILAAKSKIINSAASNVDKELYAPVFRNVSMFMRSYELMEQTLKVYVYRDGKRPIFHQPILKGLYASEGWFMKLMEGNKHFAVKKPERAHLFYMPFSSRELEHALYIPDSHNRTGLRQFVKDYKEMIAAKYPFWNRTAGTDHFFVACHDWAPFETTEHLENSIKALCNADVTIGFRIGKDVSLPETFIRYARNPLRYRGGKPPSERNILAFYAGNNHGYLRRILLKHWKDKDPDMRIYGLLPSSVSRRMNYIQHMKSSKYCICPKGFEVNSPRVVEAIFYECVPVIISDNFVPPFFEVLNWDAFSVIVAERDIPNLKNILLSIPEEKYIELQLGVQKVQQHFLWHARPVKYDLFHMILHSIWFSRVFQM